MGLPQQHGEVISLDFDTAVASFGAWVEGKLDAIELSDGEKKARSSRDIMRKKSSNLLEQLLDEEQYYPELMGGSLSSRGASKMNSQGIKQLMGAMVVDSR